MKLIDEILGWFHNPKLETRHAILFGAIIVAIVPVVGARVIGQTVWIALTAVATSTAIIVVIFRDSFWSWWNRPILEISPVDSTAPHFVHIPEISKKA